MKKEESRNDFKPLNKVDKVRWEHLSIPLKIAVVMAYIIGSLYLLIFISGIINGMVGQ